MILCPNCLHKEFIGAVFCSECGAQLIYENGVPTNTITPSASSALEDIPDRDKLSTHVEPPPPPEILEARVSLNIISSGEIIPLSDEKETTLGRISEGQPLEPDLDLTPYKAYEYGVSRMHASIINDENQFMITDLGSANGTRINGKKITSNIPYPIKHGDILTLGKFKIQILLRDR